MSVFLSIFLDFPDTESLFAWIRIRIGMVFAWIRIRIKVQPESGSGSVTKFVRSWVLHASVIKLSKKLHLFQISCIYHVPE